MLLGVLAGVGDAAGVEDELLVLLLDVSDELLELDGVVLLELPRLSVL